MAIARAISGGPVYVSDEPSKVVPQVLVPFAYEVRFTLKESGPLMIWSEKGVPKMKGTSFESVGENVYLADLPVKAGALEGSLTH